jgi:translation initiation factor 3 subunit C
MTSRFFARSDSSESESDSDEQNLYSEEEESEDNAAKAASDDSDEEDSDEADDSDDDSSSSDEGGAKGALRFLKEPGGAESSDEESEDEKVTVVRSAKDKRIEEAEGVVKLIENAVKINDWHIVSMEFDKLTKMKDNLIKMADGKMPKLYSAYSSRYISQDVFNSDVF